MDLRRLFVLAIVALWGSSVALGAGFTSLLGGSGQDYATAVTVDGRGNTYVAGVTWSKDFPVTPGAVQTHFGGTSDAFAAKLGADGKVLWATFLGGILDDGATGIALDDAGNVIVTGWTRSADFPTAHAAQATLNGGASETAFDAFAAKLDPTGTKLLYATFLGGPADDFAYGVAVDAAGSAYVAGSTSASGAPGMLVRKLDTQGALSYSFFHPQGSAAAIAVDRAGSAYVAGMLQPDAIVFKLSPDGAHEVYEKRLGGGANSIATGIAVGRDGSAYVAGMTAAVDFPLVNPLQGDMGGRPLWKTTDGGMSWAPIDHLPFANPQAMAMAPDALYAAASDTGMAKSTDGGATWARINQGIANPALYAVASDARRPGTVYAGNAMTPGALYRTTDGGAHWTAVDTMASGGVLTILPDPRNSLTVYAAWNSGVLRKSTDGGDTWTTLPYPGSPLASLAIDPASGDLWGYTQFIFGGSSGNPIPPYLWHSADGGATWTRLTSPAPALSGPILIDPSAKPSLVYIGVSFRSDDGGATWVALAPGPATANNLGPVAIGPGGTLYVYTFGDTVYASNDHGVTWTRLGAPPFQTTALVPTPDPAVLFALTRNPQTTGFVTRLSPDGAGIAFSTFLGGHVSAAPQTIVAAEPSGMTWQNGISGLALDREGNVVVAGVTRAADFPLASGNSCSNGGGGDAFAAELAADGSALLGFRCLGGPQDDGALALTVGPFGDVILAGQTWSPDLPGYIGFGDAFAVSLGTAEGHPGHPPKK
jgi:photosystem II stability/assembly factor-like uncharacterized protein